MLIRHVTIKVDGQQKALSFYTSPLSSGLPFEPERDRTYGQCRAPGTIRTYANQVPPTSRVRRGQRHLLLGLAEEKVSPLRSCFTSVIVIPRALAKNVRRSQ